MLIIIVEGAAEKLELIVIIPFMKQGHKSITCFCAICHFKEANPRSKWSLLLDFCLFLLKTSEKSQIVMSS